MSDLNIRPIKFELKSLNIDSPETLELELGGKLGLKLDAIATAADKVTIVFDLRLYLDDEQLGMKVKYAVEFEVTSLTPDFIVSDETLKEVFIQVNAPAIGYPFLRAFVANVCTNSGFKPVMLPAVNFQAIYNHRIKGATPGAKPETTKIE